MNQKPILGSQINFAHPLAQGLVGCWIMNEGCGNKIYDLSENGNTGTLNNASWTLYENGSALDFNDTNSSVEIEDNDSLDGYAEMSWSFWVIPRDIAENTAGFISKWDAVNGKRSWAVRQAEANNEIQLFISGDGTIHAHVESSGFNLTNNVLTHIVVVKKGTVGYFYKDGQFISSAGGLSSIIYAGPENVAIGRWSVLWAAYFDGLIDNIQIYNRALTPDEAQQLYYEPYAMFECLDLLSFLTSGEQEQLLVLQNSLHSHIADNVDLIQEQLLAVQNSLHSHIADNLVIAVLLAINFPTWNDATPVKNFKNITPNLTIN